MNNDNVQSYFTNVSNSMNTINVMLDIMLSQERTISSLLATQQRPIRNVSRTIPVRSTNRAYTPNTTHLRTSRDFVIPRHFNIPATQNSEQNINNLARQIINSVLHTNEQLTPVIVRPTEAQIQNATSNVLFDSIQDPYNTTCPITQQVFRSGDEVTRINRCGHLFTPNDIRTWFTTSVICPMCRIDISDSMIPLPAQQEPVQQEPAQQEPVQQEPAQQEPSNLAFSNYIYDFINQDINNMSYFNTDISGGIVFEYVFSQPVLSNILNNTTNNAHIN